MKQLPGSVAPTWVRITSEPITLHVHSTIHWWYAHYDFETKRAFRCGEDACYYCDSGRPRELRFVLGVWTKVGGRQLLELRERHRRVLDRMNGRDDEGVGLLLRVYKKGNAKNSPVEVDILDCKPCDEWDISNLVASLGDSLALKESDSLPRVA